MGPDRILREEIIHRKLIVGVFIRKTNKNFFLNTGEGYEFCFKIDSSGGINHNQVGGGAQWAKIMVHM